MNTALPWNRRIPCTKRASAAQQEAASADSDSEGPLLLPVRVALLDRSGAEQPLDCADHEPAPEVDSATTITLPFSEARSTYLFRGVAEKPVLSLLRGFSAPVQVHHARELPELAFLFAHDTDQFSRWDAGQRLMKAVIDQTLAALDSGDANPQVQPLLLDAFQLLLSQSDLDPAYRSLAMQLPSETEITSLQNPARYERTHAALKLIRRELATANRDRLMQYYEELQRDSVASRFWRKAGRAGRTRSHRSSSLKESLFELSHESGRSGNRRGCVSRSSGRRAI